MENNMQQDLGKRIRKLREDAHMSQAELARELQVSRQAVSRWESGSSVPDASIVSDLCRALGVKYESVFGAFKSGEAAASADESIQTAGEEALKEQNSESIEEIKNRLDALLAERKKKNNRKRILSATVWSMFAAAALFVLFSLSVLGLPELAILNDPTRGSSIAFGINTGADVLLLLGIILAIVIIGAAAGLMCWAKIRKEERNGKDHK